MKLAQSTAKSDHDFYLGTAEKSEMPEVKALLMVLADSESKLIEKLQHMMITGIVDELEELTNAHDRDAIVDSTPFDLMRTGTDPRIFVCNKVLERSIKTYTLYLRLATKTKSELGSRLFEYLAYLKKCQLDELRNICENY
jgi:hypothetical protein